MPPLANDWLEPLKAEFSKEYYRKLHAFVTDEYNRHTVYPPADDIFNAMHFTPLSQVKAVIIGQDPYHEYGQAHGLCFSVKKGVKVPPSLVNIYSELKADLGLKIPNNGYLEKWARQGVLMLNSVLTVEAGKAASHRNMGWEEFTDAVIRAVNELDRPVVYLLWGSFAISKKKMLNNKKHLVLTAPHPSPLSAYRGFFGCRHFSKCNDFLVANGETGIDWQIPDI